jgi:hypothetical protein
VTVDSDLHALSCTQCQRLLVPDEPVWRTYVRHGPNAFGTWAYWLQPFCATCHDQHRVYAEQACPRCERPVHDELRGAYARARRRPFCSDRCRWTFYNQQHRRAFAAPAVSSSSRHHDAVAGKPAGRQSARHRRKTADGTESG